MGDGLKRNMIVSLKVLSIQNLALMAHGKNWKLIENIVETRTTSQVRSHAQKFFLKIIKIEKERKKNLKKGILLASKAD